MKRSEADKAIFVALRPVVAPETIFRPVDVVGLCAGLAGKRYPELNKALEMARVRQSAKGLGHCLKRLQGMVIDDWRLCARRNRVTGNWAYRFANVAGMSQDEFDLLDAEEFEDRMRTIGPVRQSVEIRRQLEKIDAREEITQAQAAVDEMTANMEEIRRAAAEQAAQTAGKVDEWETTAKDATRLYSTRIMSRSEAESIVATINRPADGILARLHNESDTSGGSASVAILLPGPWPQRKDRYQALLRLFSLRSWGTIDGEITPALIRGAAIPATASKDPAHYDTARMTVEIANSLAEQGISSLDLPLDEAVLRNRAWQQWNVPRGDPVLNPHRTHIGMPIPMSGAKFDPVGDPNPNRWTQKL